MPTLTWRGKDAVLNHHLDVPYHLLKCEPELSAGCPGSGNLIVEGDNLLALKALLPYYKGQVKCIYIDPPYNTGIEEWIYNDNVNSPEIRAWLGRVVGKETEDLNRHDKWLCMMWPRLQLLHEMLAEEGTIWVSIDDNEAHVLKLIMDDLFGRSNFVTSFIWRKVDSPNDNKPPIAPDHEHILVYARNKAVAQLNKKVDPEVLHGYPNELPDGRRYRDRILRKNGKSSLRTDRESMWFPLTAPDRTIVYPMREDGLEGRWAYGKKAVSELGENLIWKNRGAEEAPVWVPYSREWAPEVPVKPNPTILYDAHTSRQAKAEVKEILGHPSPLETIKPVLLLETILRIATRPGDLILDSFAGSATTAHAVMKLNAEDGGERNFILVEMDSTVARTVTVERARRVARGYTNNDGEAVPGLGSDFRYCTLGAPLFRGNGSLNEELTRDTLARHLFFTEFGEPLTANPQPGSSLVGTFGETALHLLWDADGPSFLDAATLRGLPAWDGEFVVYGEGCAIPSSVLQERRVSFRQIPYRVRG